VEAMRFLTAKTWWPGRSSYAATSVLADEAYALSALRIPWGEPRLGNRVLLRGSCCRLASRCVAL
jgi:hypothetical protein